jgi:hypothetical protein
MVRDLPGASPLPGHSLRFLMTAFIPISALAIALASGAAIAGGNDRYSGSTAQFEWTTRSRSRCPTTRAIRIDEQRDFRRPAVSALFCGA